MVTVRHPGVSRRHVRLQVCGGELTVTDLGSMNGTRVNGLRIAGTTRLALGDKVSLAAVDIAVVGARTAHQGGTVTAVPPASLPASPPAPSAALLAPTRPFPNYLQLRRRVPTGAWPA